MMHPGINPRQFDLYAPKHILYTQNFAIMEPIKPIGIILCGIPASGKSTYVKKLPQSFKVVSRDEVRWEMYGKGYRQNQEAEKKVTKAYNHLIGTYFQEKQNIAIDKTHATEDTLTNSIGILEDEGYKVYIKFFNTPVWLCKLRELKRRLLTGVKVPHHVIDRHSKSFKEINQENYKDYSL